MDMKGISLFRLRNIYGTVTLCFSKCQTCIHGRSFRIRLRPTGDRLLWTSASGGRRGVPGETRGHTRYLRSQSQDNIILMGSPGSGKTTVGRILASQLGRPVLDIDNDHLESYWGMTVAQKLAEMGSDGFVVAEGEATQAFQASGHVVSLTGSNPMHSPTMRYLRTLGTVIFLDVQHQDIVERLEHIQVNRMVGQGEGVPVIDILRYRQQFYESSYDVRIVCELGETPEGIAQKVRAAWDRLHNPVRYVSTRGRRSDNTTFNDVVLEGLASDSGLYLPEISAMPHFTIHQWHRLVEMSYTDRALRVLESWIPLGDVPPQRLGEMVLAAYGIDEFNCHKVFPVVTLEERLYIQELFHGPTASFKDAALQLMPRFFTHALNAKSDKSLERHLILVATSGDTGSAVLDGFSKITGDSHVDVVVLYPEDGISAIQKAQMTAAEGGNVHVFGVRSDFDFCQSSIKQIFTDKEIASRLREKFNTKLSAANSINWGRLLPQVVYHASAYLDLVKNGVVELGQEADLCIPTGNFGNILAAYYSKLMGIPWRRLVCASNTNNVLTDFIHTGCYDLTSRHLRQTSSPAIDILKSSNLERYLYHVTGGDTAQVRAWYEQLDREGSFSVGAENLAMIQDVFEAGWCSSEDCRGTIADTWNKLGYMLDPHTAVAKTVADRFRDSSTPMVISATAHYAKFAHDVLPAVDQMAESPTDSPVNPQILIETLEAMGPTPRGHTSLTECLQRPCRHHRVCAATVEAITVEVEEFLARRGRVI